MVFEMRNPGHLTRIFVSFSDITIELNDHSTMFDGNNGELTGIKAKALHPTAFDGELGCGITAVTAAGPVANGKVVNLTAIIMAQRAGRQHNRLFSRGGQCCVAFLPFSYGAVWLME